MEIINNKYFGENIYLTEYSCAFSSDTFFSLFEDRSSFSLQENNLVNLQIDLHNERLDISSILADNKKENSGVLYLLYDIEADMKSRVILNTAMPVNSKVFLNNTLLTTIGIDTIDHKINHKSNFVCFDLNKGINHFIVEIFNPECIVWLNILLMNYEHEISETFSSISQIGNYSNHMDINYVCERIFTYNSTEYCFMVMNNDDIFLEEYEIYIYDQYGNIELRFKGIYKRKECIDLLELSKDNKSVFLNYFIIIKAIKKDGNYFSRSYPIVLHNPYELISKILIMGNEYLHRLEDTNEASDITARLSKIKYSLTNYGELTTYIQCYDFYNKVFKTKVEQVLLYDEIRVNCEMLHCDNELQVGNIKEIDYLSEIDLCKERILIRLPNHYDENEKYPLILHLAIGRYSWDAHKVDNMGISNSFIFADISIRGQTLGGYMGEANVFESLNKIEEQYSIDKNRIYLEGASNGGYAAWRLLGKFPHIFAAGYPLASIPLIKDINNMYNLPIITLFSDIDIVWFGKDMLLHNKLFTKNLEFKQVYVKGIVHSQLIHYVVNHKVMEYYLINRLNTFPQKVIYRTNSNRYRKVYWLELHELCFGLREAVINAEFHDSRIDIVIKNSEGVNIIIPPQIKKNYFIVNINNESFIFNDCNLSEVCFRLNHNLKKYILSDNLNNDYRPKSRKGYGLLDIYFDKLRIIIPDNCNQSVKRIAENLSHPHSYSNDGEIYVNYPILNYRDVELEVWGNNSLICICGNNYLSTSLKPDYDLYINTFEDGISYMGNIYYGDYLVMQIVPNPVNGEYSILYIDFNNPEYLKKNLFLRKMIISGEFNGHHPYLNNEALVLLNGSFFSIYEWGEELKQIHNKNN